MEKNHPSFPSRKLAKSFRMFAMAAVVCGSVNVWSATQDAKPVAVKPAAQKTAGLININTADVSLLAELDGIGEAKAAAIVDHRKQHGPFKTIEQLAEVKGIGEKFVEKNRTRMTVR